MIRFCVFFLFLISALTLSGVQNDYLYELFYSDAETFCFYLNEKPAEVNKLAVANGNGAILTLNKEQLINNNSYITNLGGESVVIVGKSLNYVYKKLNLVVLSKEDFDGFVLITGYSNKLKANLISDNELINVQILYKNGKCVVGSPLIMQGF